MKKASLLFLMIAIVLLCFSSCGSENSDEEKTEIYASAVADADDIAVASGSSGYSISDISMSRVTSLKDKIEAFTEENLNSHSNCRVDTLTVFDAHNPDAPGTYKIYTMVSYKGKEPADSARSIITGFSENTAGQLDRYFPEVTVMDIIWTSSEFNGRATLHFEKDNGQLVITQSSFNSNFGNVLNQESADSTGSGSSTSSSTYYQNLSEVNPST